jgi:SAM-dependent methyltransferase
MAALPLKDLWSKNLGYRAECESETDTIVQLLNLESAGSLADVGCGNGVFSVAAARAYPRLKVFAYDALPSAIAEYNVAALGLRSEQIVAGVAPVEDLPIASSSVDRVLCRAVLHHIAKPALLYAEIHRILKPGGELLLQAPCNFWKPHWSQFMSDFYMLMDDSHRRQYHTPAEVIAGLAEVGLLMYRTDCWTYTMNNLNDRQLALVARHHAAERVRLRQTEGGQWAADFYWVRILARKL